MCLAIPVCITEILDSQRALASAGGVIREINTALVDDLKVGDYVVLHVGFALSKLDQAEAATTLALMERGQSSATQADLKASATPEETST